MARNRQQKILLIVVIVLLIIVTAYTLYGKNSDKLILKYSTPTDAQGYYLNNPGNIRKSPDVFNGEVPTANCCFKAFESMAYGYRAMFVILYNNIKGGNNTMRGLISKWAPPTENNTNSYIESVSQMTGISPDKIISPLGVWGGFLGISGPLVKIVRVMSIKEIGYVNEAELQKGYDLFLNDKIL